MTGKNNFMGFVGFSGFLGFVVSPRVLAVLILCLLSGCLTHLREPLPPGEQLAFRDQALGAIKAAAYSNDPTLVMQAIEAIQEVAPKEGLHWIGDNIRTRAGNQQVKNYAGITFAGLMALGTLRDNTYIDDIRTYAEDTDPNVVIAALFALHRLGEQSRTGELAGFLLEHRDARVRANTALALGKLKEPSSKKLLLIALRQEKKKLPKLQITEALALLGNRHATEMLLYDGNSSYPDQATLAMIFLGNAASVEAEDLFRDRLTRADFPEIKLAAARGLGVLGFEDGFDVASRYLRFNSPRRSQDDPPSQQIARIRGLAALALEAIGNPEALGPLREAFEKKGQRPYVRLAIARAAVSIINRQQAVTRPARGLGQSRVPTSPGPRSHRSPAN